MNMKRLLCYLVMLVVAFSAAAQERKPMNKPYIDLRPMHFGILVGLNMQDIEMRNVGPQLITQEDGTQTTETVLCDQDNWNPGFSVGVLADLRAACGSHHVLRCEALSVPQPDRPGQRGEAPHVYPGPEKHLSDRSCEREVQCTAF